MFYEVVRADKKKLLHVLNENVSDEVSSYSSRGGGGIGVTSSRRIGRVKMMASSIRHLCGLIRYKQ